MRTLEETTGRKKKEATLEKVGECLYRNTSSKKYIAIIKIKGRQIKRSLETIDPAEARRKLLVFRRDVEKLDPSAKKLTLDGILKKYLASISHQGKSTRRGKEIIIRRIQKVFPGGADQMSSRVKPSQVLEFLSGFKSRSHYVQALHVLKSAFDIAVDDGLMVRNPVIAPTVKQAGKARKKTKTIYPTPTHDEFLAILNSIRNLPMYGRRNDTADMIEFMGRAGLGQAETFALKWEDIDFTAKTILTFRWKMKTSFVVPIFPWLRPLLIRRYNEARTDGKQPSGEDKVFPIKNPSEALKAACKRLGFQEFTPRSLRRMFCTMMLQTFKRPVPTVALWQGHQDGGALLLKTYSHVLDSHSADAAELVML